MEIEHVENKHIKITIKAEDEEEYHTVVKVKFYPHDDGKLLAHFARKSGNIMKWYELFKNIKET